MKRKSFIGVLLAVVLFVAAFGLIACGERNNEEQSGTHTHAYSEKWTYDEDFHWHKATCEHTDEINGRAAHSFDGNKCRVCDYEKGEDIPDKVFKTVSFDLNGGNGSLDDMQFAVGEVMATLPIPTRDEYKFIGWQDILGNEYNAASVMGGNDLQLIAQWKKLLAGYADQYVSLRPASEGYKSQDIHFQYAKEVDKFVYVEITSDNLKGKPGAEYNFDLKSIEGMEYSVESGYTWTWYRDDFETPNGAQRFSLGYGSNIQFVTVANSSGVVMQSYLLDIYVKRDYYIKLYENIFAAEPYDSVRVIEKESFPASTKVKEIDDFEFDARVYFNENTRTYEKFVYSTVITDDWNLYQTYKPVTVAAELSGGTLSEDLVITPYTQYFTLPSPEREGYDFLGWQLENGEYLTNIQGYSGVNYISEENNPQTLTAVYAKKKYYYTFDGDKLKTKKTVPVATYTDKTMRTISDITYVPYNTDCVLPIKTEQVKGEIFTGWQHYYLSDKGAFSKSLSEFDFGVKVTKPFALAPETADTDDYAVPLNGELTSHNTGTFRMYLPAEKRYTLEISATGTARIRINAYGTTAEQTVNVTSASPARINLDYYEYNRGETVRSHGYVTFTVTSLSGAFTAKLKGDTAVTSGSPVVTNDDNTAEIGEKFSVKLVKPGYAFEGWYDGQTKISDDQSITMEDAEKEITAKWFACPVTLERSIPDAGSVSGLSGTTVIGEDVTVTATTNNGYTWVGWTDESGEIVEAEQSFTFVMPSENVKYIAKWIKVTAEKNVTAAGSVTQPSGKYKAGDEATLTATTNSGYTWVGWKDESGEIVETNQSYTFNMPTESATFTATWAKVTLARNDSSAGRISSLTGKYTAEQKVKVSATTNSGYTFLGWFDGETLLCETADYTFNMPSEDATYTAKWTYYTLTTEKSDSYAGNITAQNAVKITAGQSVTITASTYSGYTWQGWYNGDKLLSESLTYTFNMPAESVTYTAKWTYFTVTTNTNDADAGTYTKKNNTKITAGQSVTLEAKTNAGYTWQGWYNGEELLTKELTYTFDMPSENVNYTAKWVFYTITTAVNDSAAGSVTAIDAAKTTVGDSVTVIAATNAGYTFLGWYKGEAELAKTLSYTYEMTAENAVLTAKWIACPLTLEKSIEEAGSVSMPETTIIGQDYTITAQTNSGYTWLGWYNGDTKITEDLSHTFTMSAENVTYTAKWTYYTLTTRASNSSAGRVTPNNATKTTVDESVTIIATTNSGYTFIGWFDGDTKLTSELRYTFDMPSKNITYTAKWIKVTIAKSEKGGSVSSLGSTYKVGDSVTVTAATSLISDSECYVFLGWFDGENRVGSALKYTFAMPDTDKTFIAKWIKVTLNKDMESGGTVTSIRDRYLAGDTKQLTATTKNGYIWIGWFKGNELLTSDKAYTLTMPSEDTVYTAKWTQITLNKNIDEAGTITQPDSAYTAGQTMTISAQTNMGYTWLGWYNGNEELTRDSEYTFVIPSEAVNYTAKWGCYIATLEAEEGGTYSGLPIKIKFDLNGGIGDIKELTVTSERQALDYVPTKSGYIFKGWYMNANCTTRYSYGTALEDGTVLYAGWQSTEIGKAYYRKALDIAGNYNTADNHYTENLQFMTTADKCFQAYFTAYTAGKYYVNYKSDNGREMYLAVYNVKSTSPLHENSSFTTTSYTRFAITANAGDVFYIKSYILGGQYRVPDMSFYIEGGEYPEIAAANPVESKKIAAGTEITVNAITKLGYAWLGWFKDDTEVTKETSLTFTMPYENVTYKAKWQILDGLEPFTFETTADSFIITGLKDKTVTEIVIPDFVTKIGKDAFRGCMHLHKATIGRGVKTIDTGAFFECYKLTEVYNYSTIKFYLKDVSYGSVTLYADKIYTENAESHIVTTADKFVFYEDENLSYLIDFMGTLKGDERILTLPNRSPSGRQYGIRNHVFYKNSEILIVSFSDGITSIGNYAFAESSLTNVIISDSVTEIGNSAFKNCNGLQFAKADAAGVKTIGREAFYGCSIMRINGLPNELTSIGEDAFYGCGQLRDIVIPDTVTQLGAGAFSNSGVVNVKIGRGIAKIDARTFEACHRLTTIVIGSNIAEIADTAFIGCLRLIEVCNLSSLTITKATATYGGVARYAKYVSKSETDTKIQKSGDYVFYINGTDVFLVDYAGGVAMAELTLPAKAPGDKTYTIYKFAFYGNIEIVSVVIPDTVKSAEGGVFYGCTYLGSVTLGKNITSLGTITYNNTRLSSYNQKKEFGFFERCVNLDTVNMDNLTSIGTKAFYHCDKLADITIGSGVTFIGGNAFGYTLLTNVIFNGTKNWKIYFPGYSDVEATINAATLKNPEKALELMNRYVGYEWRGA